MLTYHFVLLDFGAVPLSLEEDVHHSSTPLCPHSLSSFCLILAQCWCGSHGGKVLATLSRQCLFPPANNFAPGRSTRRPEISASAAVSSAAQYRLHTDSSLLPLDYQLLVTCDADCINQQPSANNHQHGEVPERGVQTKLPDLREGVCLFQMTK